MKIVKKILIILLVIISLLLLIIGIAFGILKYKTNKIMDDYSEIYKNDKYKNPVQIENIAVFKQDVSCGYAVIEMFSKWNNGSVTEEYLYDTYGKVVTSTGKSFEKEMNKQFLEYKTTMHKYLSSEDLIDKVYTSLSKGMPVPVEWAAKYEDEWTLHYSLITGLDVANDKVTIANPYGYTEEITIKEFINRTNFKSYEKMPLFLKFGFAFGFFEKNTIYIIEEK